MTRSDKILTISLILISIFSLIFLNFFIYSSKPLAVVIEVDGKPYARYEFSQIDKEKYVNVTTKFGYNLVKIEKDRVCIVDASCPDKLDIKAGYISKPNQVILCIPNRLSVRIEGNNSKVDRVAY